MDVNEINILVLAYLGDTIYEGYVREYLINKRISNVNDLQKESINFVSAKSQAQFLTQLMEKNLLSQEELDVVKRARNYRNSRHPKNCDIITYKHATALEALIGYLHLVKNDKRVDQIMKYILSEEEK